MTERPTYEKTTCACPGCPRWSRLFPPGWEWLCGRHWKTVKPRLRRALRRCWRRTRDLHSFSQPTPAQSAELAKLNRIGEKLWFRAVWSATMHEAGL